MILIYCGTHKGNTLAQLIGHFQKIIAFEADPEHFIYTKNRFSHLPYFEIYNYAVSNEDGYKSFNISSNNGESSSLSGISNTLKSWGIGVANSIQIKIINLFNFLKDKGIDSIDLYFSDIQGYDLTVLNTLKPLLESRKIKMIQCEVEKDNRDSLYIGPNNKFKGFDDLLKENYEVSWTQNVPDTWLELDVRWQLKNSNYWADIGIIS